MEKTGGRTKSAEKAKVSQDRPEAAERPRKGSHSRKKMLTPVDGTCVEMLRRTEPRRNNTSGVAGKAEKKYFAPFLPQYAEQPKGEWAHIIF